MKRFNVLYVFLIHDTAIIIVYPHFEWFGFTNMKSFKHCEKPAIHLYVLELSTQKKKKSIDKLILCRLACVELKQQQLQQNQIVISENTLSWSLAKI